MTPEPLLIAPAYRLAVVWRFVIGVLLGFALFGLGLWLAMNRPLGAGYAEDIATMLRLADRLPGVAMLAGAIAVIVVGGALFFLLLILTHAVFGPMVRVRRSLRMMADGHPATALRFRGTDQLYGLSAQFQALAAAQARRCQAYQAEFAQAERLLKEGRQAAQGTEDRARLRAILEALNDCYGRLHEMVTKGKPR